MEDAEEVSSCQIYREKKSPGSSKEKKVLGSSLHIVIPWLEKEGMTPRDRFSSPSILSLLWKFLLSLH